MTEIKSRILKMEMVKWRDLKWIQGTLKEMKKDSYIKLKKSLLSNNFAMPFHVWDDGKTQWICDGHHRQRVMVEMEKDGITIPDILPAVFIDCKDKKEAQKLVLVYSSIYAHITDEGLYEFIMTSELNFDELKEEIDLPEIDFKQFEESYFSEEKKLLIENEFYTLTFTFLKDDAAFVQEKLHEDREINKEKLDEHWRERCLLRLLKKTG